MTSPVSAIEAIEKADRIWAYTNGRGSRVWTPMKPVIAGAHEEQEYVLADIHSALARQAEALQRENAEKDARIAEMAKVLTPFARIADMTRDKATGASVMVNVDRCRDVRALLGGENAE
jgi:hypothetical protein